MKRRAMKKYIPHGPYCGNCKNKQYLATIKRDKNNCKYKYSCDENCWTSDSTKCKSIVFKCRYWGIVDWYQETTLNIDVKVCRDKL